MLQWVLVFSFLLIEVILCFIVILPLPRKWSEKVLKMVASLLRIDVFKYLTRIFGVLLLVLFAEAIWGIHTSNDKLLQAESENVHTDTIMTFQIKLFRHQRNAYLTGFSFFLIFVLMKFSQIIEEKNKAVLQNEFVSKQSKNNSDAHMNLLDDNEKLEVENKKMQAEIVELTESLKSLQALKKQAENQQKEYERLLHENDVLHHESHLKKSTEKKDQ
eukprot:GCRY01000721.1.p1 GENE.GCRY01000721.1~~GCRY01000721.1.p1  ORF type:complete len:217 (+),score=28.93 GCRY01000721.1:188-838(+)